MFNQPADDKLPAGSNGLAKHLAQCCQGEAVTVISIDPGLAVGQRLRELGLIEGSQVILLRQSDPLLILVKESRIALDPKTAIGITVYCECHSGKPAS